MTAVASSTLITPFASEDTVPRDHPHSGTRVSEVVTARTSSPVAAGTHFVVRVAFPLLGYCSFLMAKAIGPWSRSESPRRISQELRHWWQRLCLTSHLRCWHRWLRNWLQLLAQRITGLRQTQHQEHVRRLCARHWTRTSAKRGDP